MQNNEPTPTNDPEWERLCRRCGRCCFEKWVDESGTIHDTSIPCRYLDIVSRTCKVYHQRLSVGEGCIRLTPEVVATLTWLPADCGYVNSQGRSLTPFSRQGASDASSPSSLATTVDSRSAPRRGQRRRRERDT